MIADVPYNLGKNAYASNPAWYKDGDNKNGENDKAGKMFFESDGGTWTPRLRLRDKEGVLHGGEGKDAHRVPADVCIWRRRELTSAAYRSRI